MIIPVRNIYLETSGFLDKPLTQLPFLRLLSIVRLAKGSYVFQVGVTTWPYDWPNCTSKVTSQELRKRWLKYGNLVTGLVYSNFAQFNLLEHFENPPCP